MVSLVEQVAQRPQAVLGFLLIGWEGSGLEVVDSYYQYLAD